MRGWLRTACCLLFALGALLHCGCFGGAANPSYFPYYLPPGDVIQTHAKPPGLGYFADFDNRAASLEISPTRCTNQVGRDQVVIATVFDDSGQARRKRRIEWILEGPGEILEVDESGYTAGRGYLMSNTRGVTYTSHRGHTFTRGNDNPKDDFVIDAGQTWCIVRSMKPGETVVTAYAPEIYNHDRRTAITRLTWTDGPTQDSIPEPRFTPNRNTNSASFPEVKPVSNTTTRNTTPKTELLLSVPASVPYNQESTLTLSLVNRDTSPWDSVVLETILPNDVEYIRSEDEPSVATGQQLLWTAGPVPVGAKVTRRVIVRPMRKGDKTFSASARFADGTNTNARATTTVGGGNLQINLEVPETSPANQPVPVGVLVRNPGTTAITNTSVWITLPHGVTHTTGKNPVEVTIGTLPPDGSKRIEVPLSTTKPGRYTLRANAVADGNMMSTSEVVLETRELNLTIAFEGSTTAVVQEPTMRRLVVTNTSDTPLQLVNVTLDLPEGWRGKKSDAGTTETEGALRWTLPTLAARTRQTVSFSVTPSATPTNAKLEAYADTNGASVRAELALRLSEAPVLQLDSLEVPASLANGETATLRIIVRNVGRGPARNVDVGLTTSGGVRPQSGSGPNRNDASINGDRITFALLNELAPGTSATFNATIRSTQPGEARVLAMVQASGLNRPLTDEQQLRVRGAE